MAPDLPSNDAVSELLTRTLVEMVQGTAAPVDEPPSEVKPLLDDLLKRPSTMRDGILMLLAYAVAAGEPLDFRELPKFPGARNVAQYVADELLPSLKIAGKKDALQTGVKGVPRYIDRANKTWQATLMWASEQNDIRPVEQAFRYLAAGMAATARDLPPMPGLDTPSLTFGRTFGLLDAVLTIPSGGAHEQFIFAALLEAYLLQLGIPGHVETKNIYAADASAGTAADVQHKQGNQVIEAYEVTANDWRTKVRQAYETLRARDLQRVHILGSQVTGDSGDALAADLPDDADVSVLDGREEIRSLVARLDKFHRRHALNRLYSHLVERQSDDSLVRGYVAALAERGLT